MPLSFPGSPSVNDTYTVGQRTWTWDGYIWSLSADTIGSASVTSSEIASSAVTTAKIADANVTAAKIASDAVTTAKILDANVTTAKVAANAITQAKLASNLSAVTVTTTANRDTDIAAPFTGQLAILTDTRKIQLYDGTSWVNVSLAPPETPTSLSATAVSTTSISIAFTAGGANGSAITNYKYALSTDGGATYGSFTALSPADFTTPITISGLTAGTTYYIKLKAVNDMGDSVASSAVSIVTLSTPDAPTSLSAGSITTNSVAISFTAGAQGGSAISNYQYAISTNGGSTYGSFTALSPADFTTPITISGLTDNTAYYVKLKAVNTDGAGAESSAVSFTTAALSYPTAVDYLVVAGGGGGGSNNASGGGAGGGAGGLRSTITASGGSPGTVESALAVSGGTSYTVTVGNGGVGGTGGTTTVATQGGNSVFSTITSIGGGRGGGGTSGDASRTGGNGGSGGGSTNTPNVAGGLGTANQGFAGGGDTGGWNNGGGGGGASAVGVDASDNTNATGVGGAGRAVAISGSSVTYAGGGGSGCNTGGTTAAGGAGGGGTGGASAAVGANGTVNLGGGGGGGGNAGANGGNGGAGIVIIRYANTFADIATIGAGLTYTFLNTGGYKIYSFTAGTGNISF